ncbi:MAG TPA: ABC transporter permease [Blastocatellia bacterium]
MLDHNKQRFTSLSRRMIALIGVVVPRRFRSHWKREWEAELEYREALLDRWDRLDWRNKLALLRRASGAFWDAMLLQPRRLEDEMFQDLRYGARMLLKSKGFTAVAVLSLALGIGANTAIFSVIDAAMLRTLPVERPGELAEFSRLNPQGGGESFTYPQFEQFRERSQVFTNVFGFAYRQPRVNIGGKEEPALVQIVTGQYFSALGVKAGLGRTWATATDHASGVASTEEQIAVISDGFWRRKFAGDAAAIGKSVTINGNAFTVIGVATPDFFGVSLDYAVDVWLPVGAQPQIDGESELNETGRNWLKVMARLKPGVSLAAATADADLIFHQYLSSVNASPEALAQRIGLTPGGRPVFGMRKAWSQPLLMLLAIVVLVLLIACANLANLLLAKASARQREITTRLALGATRLRLVRQLLTESMLLALLSGAAGIFLGKWGSDLLMALTFNGLALGPTPKPLLFRLDLRILGFTILISMLAGILFGLAPALKATRPDLIAGLNENTSHLSGNRHRRRLNRFLVAGQLAASLVLLIMAGLFVRSFQKLASVELGFDPQVAQARVTPPPNYTDAERERVWSAMREKLAAYPGALSVSESLPGLFSHYNFYTEATVEGRAPRKGLGERDRDVVVAAGPRFFSTLGMPLLLGRDFGSQDHQNSVKVTIVNEALAHRLFPGRNPLGQYLSIGEEPLEVVGVVKDAKYDSVLADARSMLYFPLEQFPPAHSSAIRFFEVRAAGDAANFATRLQQIAQGLDQSLSVESRPLADLVDQSLLLQHLIARLTGFFGLLGLSLACLGVYGIMSYTVTQRASEMGIRMALGARPGDIIRQVLSEAMWPVLSGVAFGLVVAVGATRFVASQLFGLTATDPLTILLATCLMGAVAGLAAYFPARKAARVEPMVVLRRE